jgi:Glycosyl transferases group 1
MPFVTRLICNQKEEDRAPYSVRADVTRQEMSCDRRNSSIVGDVPSNTTADSTLKPTLLLFQYRYEGLAPFLLMHQREHAQCLSYFFNVNVIQHDCDYRQMCDLYRPDLVIFESGVPFASCKRPRVTNVRACSRVPKLGFLNADGFGEGRSGFLSDMDHWGVETIFAISVTAAEHTPALAQRLFVWPNFANSELYRDYGESKEIQVLFTGNVNSLYPWRRKMLGIIPKHFPSVICAHPGYNPRKLPRNVILGESYGRMLNCSWIVPACGTVAKEIVRKHFEIPACRSCLVTERSPALQAAGFVDMKNCVFADETDVTEKLEYLLSHRDDLQAIIDAGYKLVHTRHIMKRRDQILQWYNLSKSLGPNQKIIQKGPFEPLQIVDANAGLETVHIQSNGHLVSLLHEGNRLLWRGAYAEAEKRYTECLSYYRYMPEPMLGLGVCKLYHGRPKEAIKFILTPLQATLADYDCVDPDPVEWAYYVVALLCLGRVRQAARRSREFLWVRHPELDRIRWVVEMLSTRTSIAFAPSYDGRGRSSIHQLSSRPLREWLAHLIRTLRSCGQRELANALVRLMKAGSRGTVVPAVSCGAPYVDEARIRRMWSRQVPLMFFRFDACGFLNRRALYRNISFRLRQAVKSLLRLASTT